MYFDKEAEEIEDDEQQRMDSDDEIKKSKTKKKKSKKQIKFDDDDEDDEDDEEEEIDYEKTKAEFQDFINDDEVEEEEEDEDENEKTHKKSSSSSDNTDLEDDELRLIQENLGLNDVKALKKRKRIKLQDDSSEDDLEPQPKERKKPSKPKKSRERIENNIEEVGDEVEDENEQSDEREQDEENFDNFIVDDSDDEGGGTSGVRREKRKKNVYTDEAQQEALDIFGVNADELGLGDSEEDEEDEEGDYEDEEAFDEEGEEDLEQVRRRQRARKLKSKQKLEDIFEPIELERNLLTEYDQQIRIEDKPERFMLRSIQVQPEPNDNELDREAEWIYKQLYDQKLTISQQEFTYKPPSIIPKIRDVLNYMRNQFLEVPFIVTYRKEYILPELNVDDLWKIYEYDEKYVQLKQRKDNLIRLMQRMQKYQFEQLRELEPQMENLHLNEVQLRQLDAIRAIDDSDIDRIRNVQTSEEFMDCYQHFKLYYSSDIDNMRKKETIELNEQNQQTNQRKQALKKDRYHLCRINGLATLAKKFGLTPEQFGENLLADYQKHDIDQESLDPMSLAQEYISDERFANCEQVLESARFMVATQLARDPNVKAYVRDLYMKRAAICVRPTQKGFKEIDENHVCYAYKYLKDKPVISLKNEQYLRLSLANEDKLIEMKFNVESQEAFKFAREEASRLSTATQTMDTDDFDAPAQTTEQNPEALFYQSIDSMYRTSIYEKLKSFYQKDEFSFVVEQWNTQRAQVITYMLEKILFPELEKELRAKLLNESKLYIKKMIKNRLASILKIAPYKPDTPFITYDGQYEYGCKLFAIAYNPDEDDLSYCVSLNGNGDFDEFIRLRKLTLRTPKSVPTPGSQLAHDLVEKEEDFEKLKQFIIEKKPQVIAISAENRAALDIQQDIKNLLAAINQENNKAGTSRISVELVDNELAKLYSVTKTSDIEFKDQNILFKLAVALGRYLQDPLLAFSQLCNADNDILSFKYHQLQEYLTKDELKQTIECEFINFTNQVGVDLNRCVQCPYTSNVLQFVSGLGPRKANHIVRIAKQKAPVINRSFLVTECTLGSKVFINCAGFIRLDVDNLSKDYEDDTSEYPQTDVLDSTRIHPEAYEWARKMAIDALDMDDTNDTADANAALKEILESPERLNHLDLDVFATELERTGLGLKKQTLDDIKNELFNRFADTRQKLELNQNEIFHILTKETPQTLYTGKLVLCKVTGFSRMGRKQKDNDKDDDEGEPIKDHLTGLWKCPKCKQASFHDLGEVWNHLDNVCPGKASGVNVVLDNGLNGFIPLNFLSDSRVKDPEERVQRGQTIYARIVNINTDRFSVKLTSKSSDLRDEKNQWRPIRDQFYDRYSEDEELRKIEEKKKREEHRQTYTKRVIAHPQFKNIGYQQCVVLLKDADIGDAIIRPSSKGDNHLTVTWKVNQNVFQHVDIIEEKKINSFSLGKRLIIDGEEYEDLDEILARYISPMVGYCREVYSHKYYRPELDIENMPQIDSLLLQEQRQAPNKIPYFFICDKRYPGKFLLSYMVRLKARHEHFTVTPEGFRFRNIKHKNFTTLINWFKKHFHEPIPAPQPKPTPSQMSIKQTPIQTPYSISNATPYNPPPTTSQNDDWDDGPVPQSLPTSSVPSSTAHSNRDNYNSNRDRDRGDFRGGRGGGGDRGSFRGGRGRDGDNFRGGGRGGRGRGDFRGGRGGGRGDFRGGFRGRGGGSGGPPRRDWDNPSYRGSNERSFNELTRPGSSNRNNDDDDWDNPAPAPMTRQPSNPRSSQNQNDEWDSGSSQPMRTYSQSQTSFTKPTQNNNDDEDWDTPAPTKSSYQPSLNQNKTSTSTINRNNNDDDWDAPSTSAQNQSTYKPTNNSIQTNEEDWDTPAPQIHQPAVQQKLKHQSKPPSTNNYDEDWD